MGTRFPSSGSCCKWRWLVLSLLMQCASANKYCAFEIDGEPKYYVCPRNENCCSIGCCVNLAFHFYQLWYYWLLVIFLFMLCSGGGWWFRFCRSSSGSRGNLTRTPATSNPSRYSHSHPHPSNGGITSHSLHATTSSLRASATRPHHHYHHPHSDRQCPHHRHQMMQHQQRARILSHRPCGQRGSMYYLQRFWKNPNDIHGQHQHPLPPSYSTMFLNLLTNSSSSSAEGGGGGAQTTADANNNDHPCSEVGVVGQSTRPINCPYYQLYGPPPSYDSVIQLTSDGVITTSCCILQTEPSPTVNSNHNHREEIIQEIVISEPQTTSAVEDQMADCGVLDAEMPLISVKCNAETTQLEDYNTTTRNEDGSGEQVVSARSSAIPASGASAAMHRSSSAGNSLFVASCAIATAHDFEDVPSTSSL